MSHIENYRNNEDYAQFLESWNSEFFAKYTDTLKDAVKTGRILDVGCGVGQVVKRLRDENIEAFGVDVSEPNIRQANQHIGFCNLYDGVSLPFGENEFDAVGAFNVLEHVDEPEAFIAELIRVLKPNGCLVISSPNFLRVLGYRDYHPRMHGLMNKWRNAKRILQILNQIRTAPEEVRFERMAPIVKDPFTPDDDAIVVTNPIQMSFFAEKYGCRVKLIACTDRHVSPVVEWGLNLPILKYLWFNSFIVAVKNSSPT